MGLSDLIAGGMDATAATELLLNVVWTIVGATLVYFMQAGFAMCEAGFTRAKNTGNILMKNMMDFVLGSLFFFIFGFAIMHGTDWNGIIGIKGFFNPTTLADADGLFNGLPIGVFLIFHTVFCATSATIVSGSMAERTKFLAYLLYRIGKYDKEGNARAIPGHNLSIAALGVFILWFCWFGFNCGSTTAASTNLGDIAMTTNLAAAAATLATLVVTWIRYGKPDVSMTFNGSLAGLVAITAGCDTVSNYSAIIIGLIAGILVVFSVEFFDKVAKIDDPVGAISVHGVCGFTGSILVGVFSPEYTLKPQVIGVLSTVAYVLVMAIIVFTIIDKTVGLRVTKGEELDGLDIHEHGCSAYADFNFRL